MRKTLFASALLIALSSCATPNVDVTDPGSLSGNLMVFWVGEDNFVYYPFYKKPLVYHLPGKIRSELGVDTIRPGAIYTDGGSIPRAVRNLAGFSPWGYGPAYIVHDWLFIAHHCIANNHVERHDPRDRDEVETVRKVDFAMSADILAAVIQALVKQNKVPARGFAPKAIYTAVDSIVAKNLWDSRDPESCHPVEPEKIREIEEVLRQGIRVETVPQPGAKKPVLVFQQEF